MNKISIITISYNSCDVIEETLKSVTSQDYPLIEYIIIDGGSDDGTLEIIDKYSDKISVLVSEHDNGIYDAMNKGIMRATGDWINFMNCGDTFSDTHVLSSVFIDNMILDNSKVIYGDCNLRKGHNLTQFKAVPLKKIHKCMPFCHQSCFVRRAFIKPFNLSYKIAADFDFFYHLYYEEGESVFQYVPVVVANYEASEGVSYRMLDITMKEFIHIRKEHLTLHWFYTVLVYIYKYKIKRLVK